MENDKSWFYPAEKLCGSVKDIPFDVASAILDSPGGEREDGKVVFGEEHEKDMVPGWGGAPDG